LRTFDRIVAAAQQPVERWLDLVRILERNRGMMLPISYLRPQRLTDALGPLGDLEIFEPHVAMLTPEGGPGTGPERAGLESSDLYVAQVAAGSPEHRAGLRRGDRLVELDGHPIRLWANFLEELEQGGAMEHELVFRRGAEAHRRPLRLAHEHGVNEFGQTYDRYTVGIRQWAPTMAEEPVPNPHPVRYALHEAYHSTSEMIELTVTSILRLFQGRLALSTIGGPLRIFEVTGTVARQGPLDYLSFMAFISINLGLLNLLPIPMLDGGHLLFYALEGVARRPVSRRVRKGASLAGLVMLLLFMVLAFTNDVSWFWPEIVAGLESSE